MVWILYMGEIYQNLAVFVLFCDCGFEDDVNFPFFVPAYNFQILYYNNKLIL